MTCGNHNPSSRSLTTYYILNGPRVGVQSEPVTSSSPCINNNSATVLTVPYLPPLSIMSSGWRNSKIWPFSDFCSADLILVFVSLWISCTTTRNRLKDFVSPWNEQYRVRQKFHSKVVWTTPASAARCGITQPRNQTLVEPCKCSDLLSEKSCVKTFLPSSENQSQNGGGNHHYE